MAITSLGVSDRGSPPRLGAGRRLMSLGNPEIVARCGNSASPNSVHGLEICLRMAANLSKGDGAMRLFVIATTFVVTIASSLAQTAQIEVTNAWARATPGGAVPGAAYLTIISPVANRLVGVSSPIAKSAQLHTMTMQGGVMRMRPITGIDLPAGKVVTLKPGGMHIMLTGLTGPLKPGQSFPLTLSLKSGGTKEVTVSVNKIGATGPAHSMGGMSMPMQH
jgi:periplasmic copper chaperone A